MSTLLHDYHRSSAAYRVRIALHLKGIAYRRREVMLLEDEQRAPGNLRVNAQGFVPTLEIDGQVLVQSLAIIDYLDATRPAPRLIPADPALRAACWARALVVAADIHPINNLRVMRALESRGADQAARDDWMRHWMREGLSALEAMAPAAGPFLGGDAPDLSDLCLVPQLFNARRFALDLSAFPRLVQADAAAQALAPFAAAHPDRSREVGAG